MYSSNTRWTYEVSPKSKFATSGKYKKIQLQLISPGGGGNVDLE